MHETGKRLSTSARVAHQIGTSNLDACRNYRLPRYRLIRPPVEVLFANKKLRQLCQSREALQREHGQGCARKVMGRLLDLEAAESLDDIRTLPGKCHELSGDRAGQLALNLSDGKRLIFEPAADPPPSKGDGGLDWTNVRSVRVIAILNYHRG
jgi:plasmid maintenance system killer protein